jgi:hypothetical protein
VPVRLRTGPLNDRSLIDLTIFSIADLRAPGTLARIGAALSRHPELRPERFGPNDPPRTVVSDLEVQLGQWESRLDAQRSQYLFFKRRAVPKSGGMMLFIEQARKPTRSTGHYFLADYAADWFDRPERLEKLADVFRELCAVMSAYYAVARPSTIWMRSETDYERHLPDLYWLNYFGPAFRARWGDRLREFGVRYDDVDSTGIVVWAAPAPLDEATLATQRQRAIEVLGKDTFVSSRSREGRPGEFVPTFGEHQRCAPSGELWLRGDPG